MAELTLQERLQPSLLDRLTDDEPGKTRESRNQSVMSLPKLRAAVLRDLAWLLNAGAFSPAEELDDYPLVARSVLNYGLPDLAGRTVSTTDVVTIERLLRQAIWDFEPRIIRHTVKVRTLLGDSQLEHNALTFEITGELWAQPSPEALFLRTEVDLESGDVRITGPQGAVAD
ncbi:MAG TPA: type VI secretion system baseplate subunit TssE [Sedimenticola sp.]|nr:type VI secretion system baseplate subunit TssE [Sedimenticola sp.]